MTDSSAGYARSAAKGVLWLGGGQVLRQVVQVVSQVLLVRLLVPDDFGLLGMALFFVGLGQLLADFGIGSAIVQAKTDDRLILSSCFWLNMAVAVVLAVAVLAAAPLIGAFYRRADLVPVLLVLSLNLVLSGLSVVPNALLYRDLRFADLAKSQVVGSLVGAIVAVAMAWWGAGVWALVVQPLVGSTVALLVCWRATGWLPRIEYSWPTVKPLASFSFALLGTNLVGYANRNADSLLIGRILGAGPLGYYAMAIQLMLYPLQQVSSVIVRVLFPTLVQFKSDLPRVRSAYLKAVGSIALVTFPVMGGLFALSEDFVRVVFGPQWLAMIPLLKVLSWVGMMQSVGTTVGTIYLATGQPGIALRVTLIAAPVLIGGMAAGLPWGILGVAIGYTVANLLFFYYSLQRAFQLIDLTLRDFHRTVLRPLLATLFMVLVLVLSVAQLQALPALARLSVCIAIGMVAYAVLSWTVNRQQLIDMWLVFKDMSRSRSASS